MNEAPKKKDNAGVSEYYSGYNQGDSDWRKFIGEVDLVDLIWRHVGERLRGEEKKTLADAIKAKLLGGDK